MPPVDIDRSDAQALIPEDVASEIIQNVTQGSVVMQLATKLPNMSRKQRRIPIISALPVAYFVNGDKGQKQTTEVKWANKFIDAEEIAVIIPVPEAVIDDADYDIWGECRPLVEQAFMAKFDRTVMHGGGPASWPAGIVPGAVTATQTVDISAAPVGQDYYDQILGEGGIFGKVEEDGYNVNGAVAALGMRARLRGLRDANKQPIFMRSMNNGQNVQGATRYELDGSPIFFPENGAIDSAAAQLVVGDWKQIVFSIRQDLTFKILTEAVIQDEAGNIVYNLAQQDMVALRCVMRLGWQLPNPVNMVNQNDATRYPFAALVP